ncbi:hypothetical protein PFISCL1PPCAC_17917, partial [Pristionchus fissidentatus]
QREVGFYRPFLWCCGVTKPSGTLAILCIFLQAIAALYTAVTVYDVVLVIVQASMAFVQIVACALFFLTFTFQRPLYMIPVVTIQTINLLVNFSVNVFTGLQYVFFAPSSPSTSVVYKAPTMIVVFIVVCIFEVIFNLFILWTNYCCYKLLVAKLTR